MDPKNENQPAQTGNQTSPLQPPHVQDHTQTPPTLNPPLPSNNKFPKSLPLSKLTILLLIVTVTVIVTTGALAGYIYSKINTVSKETATQVPTPTPDLNAEGNQNATSSWSTYTNSDKNYSIRYPSSMKIERFGIDEELRGATSEYGECIYIIGDDLVTISVLACYINVKISVVYPDIASNPSYQKTTINGYDAFLRIKEPKSISENEYYIVNSDGSFFTIDYFYTQDKDLFEKILSTFKFTDSGVPDKDVISEWETFTNSELGYRIMFPKEFVAGCEGLVECFIVYSNIPNVNFEDALYDEDETRYIALYDFGYDFGDELNASVDSEDESVIIIKKLINSNIGDKIYDEDLEDTYFERLENQNIDGVEVKVFISHGPVGNGADKLKELHIITDERHFILKGFLKDGEISEELFDQIASTFKFTDTD